jgi:tetratricopeptide (TPR) repeat protein
VSSLNEAYDFYQKSLEIAARLSDATPNSIQSMTDLAIPFQQLAVICQARGQLEEAVNWYEKLVAVSKRLVAAQPKNITVQRSLATNYASLASLQSRTNQLDAARKNFEQMLEIRTRLAKQFSNSEIAQRELADADQKLIDFSILAKNEEDADKYRKQRDELLAKIGPSMAKPPEPTAVAPVEQSPDRPMEPKTGAGNSDDN